METGISIVLKKPNVQGGWENVRGYMSFLQPFQADVWIALLITCLIVPILYGIFIQ
jgi:hypothetical protein